MKLLEAPGDSWNSEFAGCVQFRSLIAEHDAVMAEYEDKAKKCESLPKAKRAAFLQKSKYLLGLGEQLLADSKDHAKVHRCVCQDTIEATVGSFVSSSSSLLHPSCAEERVFGLIFCKERSDLLQRWVASVGAMSSIAKLLADANLSKAQRADAVHKSKLALATCVRSAARYQRHTIEHLCSRPSTGASEKVDTFPVVQETPSSSYESYIDEQPERVFEKLRDRFRQTESECSTARMQPI